MSLSLSEETTSLWIVNVISYNLHIWRNVMMLIWCFWRHFPHEISDKIFFRLITIIVRKRVSKIWVLSFFPFFNKFLKVQKPISVGLYFPPKNPRIGNSCWDLQYSISHRPLSSTLEITCKLLLGKWYYLLLLYILHKFTLTTIRK